MYDMTHNLLYNFSPFYPTTDKTSSVVSHNGKKPLPLYPTTEKTSPVVSHTGKKPLPLFPTTEENLLHCIPQRKITSSIVSHNGKKPKTEITSRK
jgi:hypothetical protein